MTDPHTRAAPAAAACRGGPNAFPAAPSSLSCQHEDLSVVVRHAGVLRAKELLDISMGFAAALGQDCERVVGGWLLPIDRSATSAGISRRIAARFRSCDRGSSKTPA